MQVDELRVETYLRTGAHEAALRQEFGDALYEDLTRLAKAANTAAPQFETQRRTVLVLPGFMGSKLSAIADGQPDLVWVQPSDLASGGITKLKWGASVAATGTILAPYLRLLLRLKLAGYDAEFMPFDWRQSPGVTGRALMRQITKRGLKDVTLVCHSMGGLVARQMAAEDADHSTITGIVTIGTPNQGSYAPVQVYDLNHSLLGPLGLVRSQTRPQDAGRQLSAGLPRPDRDVARTGQTPRRKPFHEKRLARYVDPAHAVGTQASQGRDHGACVAR